MLELHNAPISTCSQRVRLALAEKQLDWVDIRLSLDAGDHLQPSYLAMNPNGVVPTLVHDGEAIVDSLVINEYLDDVFERHPLRPSDRIQLARMRSWCHYVDEMVAPSVRFPSFNRFFVKAFSGMSDEQFIAMANSKPLRRDFYLRMGRTGFPQADVDAALLRLRNALVRMNDELHHKDWLAGDRFSLADIAVLPAIVRLEDLELSSMWSDLGAVGTWFKQAKTRPSFRIAFYPESRDFGPSGPTC